MKKIYSFLMIMIMILGAMTMTSCDDDQLTGMRMEGSWEGYMWNSNGSRCLTKFTFTGDPFRNTKGTGYWVDIYSHFDYVADRIRWSVEDGIIYIYSYKERFEYKITDYYIRNGHFEGYISDGQRESYFEMVKIDDGWIEEYNWNTGYYAKDNKSAWEEETDSIVTDHPAE